MRFSHFCISLITVHVIIGCAQENTADVDHNIYGVKIYEYSGDLENLFDKWQMAGINAVFASTELLSNDHFKLLANRYQIKTFAILPIFFAPEELEKDTTLFAITQFGTRGQAEWVHFVCPSAEAFKTARRKSIIDFVKNHEPDGISLDFIRHFAYWEKVYPDTEFDELPNTCFDERCISGFSKELNISLPEDLSTEMEIYTWIEQNQFENWIKWKNDLITNMVKEIVTEAKAINPDLLVNLHAVPWRKDDFDGAITKIVGQDFQALAEYVDYLSPMTYSHMVKREPAWIHSVVNDISSSSNAKIIPSIQVGIAYLNDTLSAEEFEQCLLESLKDPSYGVVFWNWDALKAEEEKLELVKGHLN